MRPKFGDILPRSYYPSVSESTRLSFNALEVGEVPTQASPSSSDLGDNAHRAVDWIHTGSRVHLTTVHDKSTDFSGEKIHGQERLSNVGQNDVQVSGEQVNMALVTRQVSFSFISCLSPVLRSAL